MTKIQIIIDDGQSLKGIACNNVSVESFDPDNLWGQPRFGSYQFIARDIMFDESPNLISIPDELLLRIRDHNVDEEHKYAIKQTLELKENIESLKDQVRGWELRRDLAVEDYERYHKKIIKMIDRYPMAAAEIALEDHNLECACYFANKANEKENDDVGTQEKENRLRNA